MSYKEINGDLFTLFENGDVEAIGHGANCQSIMGAGIALQVKKRYPEAYYGDLFSPLSPVQKLGNYSSNKMQTIFNFYTQFEPGPNANYIWIKSCLRKFNHQYIGTHLGLPQIGCGIGGLNWGIVREIVQRELTDCNVTVAIYKP